MAKRKLTPQPKPRVKVVYRTRTVYVPATDDSPQIPTNYFGMMGGRDAFSQETRKEREAEEAREARRQRNSDSPFTNEREY